MITRLSKILLVAVAIPWNGQQEAFRMFVIIAVVFVLLLQPDTETQP